MKTLLESLLIGTFAAIVFIIVQPMFGMLTLTSRHSTAYTEIGNYAPGIALILSWLVHIGVSVFYTFVSLTIYKLNNSTFANVLQIAFLGWVTTLLATPANEWVVRFITSGKFAELSSLSGLNTEIGPKLWLHVFFFLLLVISFWVIQTKSSILQNTLSINRNIPE